jgi:hypothetical protein
MTTTQLDRIDNEDSGDGGYGCGCGVDGHDSVPLPSRHKFPFAINIYETSSLRMHVSEQSRLVGVF